MMKGSILFLVACFFASTLAVINPSIATLTANDNNALNYALTLENLEANFYNTFQTRFSANDFATAGYPSSVYNYFNLIAAHENAHVATLRGAIIARGATPVVNCTYSWGTVTTVAQYIGLAKVFENVGVTAYDGSINRIYDANLQQVAATIATVEARHASFLNLLSGENPFPGNQGLDNATAPATIATTISPFIGTCPGGVPTLPNVTVIIPVANPATPLNPTQAQLNENDLNALNYALTLELLEATFYNTFQPTYNAAAFAAAGYAPSVSTYFDLIRTHENSHVSALQSTITSLGGVPVVACTTYNFGVTSLATYISVARTLENTGVSAYDGAVNTIFSGALKQFAATVATVEARHAAFLNNLTGNIPFPDSFDTASAPGTIVAGIRAFLGNCPAPQLGSVPVVKTVVPYNNGTDLTTGSTTRTSTTSGSAPLSFSSAVLLVVVALSAALL